MRFLGIGEFNELGALYLRLGAGGHEVKVFTSDAGFDGLDGLIAKIPDWRQALPWIREAENNGIILFETASQGELQDELRRDGYNVIGGSAFGDRLEQDRAFGQACLADIGLSVAQSRRFEDFAAAMGFIQRRPRRYVLKYNGDRFPSRRNFIGELEDGRDLHAYLNREAILWRVDEPPDFVLMDHVTGVEVGVGAYFNGEEFLDPVCIDWEHKRFFNDDLGELTGEMGTLVSYRNAGPLFEKSLSRMTDQLRAGRYVGYINLNTIVNDGGIWPLEFTCRFGYPGFAVLTALHLETWDVLFHRMVHRTGKSFRTRSGFAVGVVLTVPPFPYTDGYEERGKNQRIEWRRPLTDQERDHIHLDEVSARDGQLYSSGSVGHLMVVTGQGRSVEAARRKAYDLTRQVVVPNLRYRTDIGLRFLKQDRNSLRRLKLWPMA